MGQQTEIPVEKIEVKEAVIVAKKTAGVTQKTLKAMSEQLTRCVKEGLADGSEVIELLSKIRDKWIEKNL